MSQRSASDYFLLGETLFERGQYEDAATAWRAAMVAGDPVVAINAAVNLGTMLKRLSDLDGAEEAWCVALDHAIEDVSSRAGIALAELRASRGNLRGAADAYGAVLRLGDQMHIPQAALNLGVTEQQLGEVTEARESFRLAAAASEREPTRSMATLNLGLLSAELGDMEDAEDAFEIVTAWDDDDLGPKAKLNLGLLYVAKGERARGRRVWSELVDSGHPVVAPQAQQNLDILDEEEKG